MFRVHRSVLTRAAMLAAPLVLIPLGASQAQGTDRTTPVPQNQPQTETAPQGNGEQTLRNNSATRALDRAAGTNNSGAYPGQSDGTPGNPPGTAATRALDRAVGTNNSGAYPQNEGNATTPPASSGPTTSTPTTPGLGQQGTGHNSHGLGQNSGQGGAQTTTPR
ncbi:hypothetical protein ACFOD4_02835 [Pseudoroseomonas globiformis]|uniref:Uncharacterized protein n=1 Tax=Teichococcus globiformis TaxID=2307229 RepID=A0ABV7FYU7_9PROT